MISINAGIEVAFHGLGDGFTKLFVQKLIVSQRDNFDVCLSLDRLAPTQVRLERAFERIVQATYQHYIQRVTTRLKIGRGVKVRLHSS